MTGEVYEASKTLANTTAVQFTTTQTYLRFGVLYVDTQNCYIGDSAAQTFLIEAATPVDLSKAVPLVNIDLSTLYVKAAVAGAVVHIFGT